MYQRILVGTDGSPRALEAVRVAGNLAELTGANTLHVVAACQPFTSHEMAQVQNDLPEEFHDLLSPYLQAHDRIEAAATMLPASIKVIPHELSGDAADGILAVAEAVKADLIVVGARGLGAVERFVRGSVSTKIAHHSPCDVLIVEHDD